MVEKTPTHYRLELDVYEICHRGVTGVCSFTVDTSSGESRSVVQGRVVIRVESSGPPVGDLGDSEGDIHTKVVRLCEQGDAGKECGK